MVGHRPGTLPLRSLRSPDTPPRRPPTLTGLWWIAVHGAGAERDCHGLALGEIAVQGPTALLLDVRPTMPGLAATRGEMVSGRKGVRSSPVPGFPRRVYGSPWRTKPAQNTGSSGKVTGPTGVSTWTRPARRARNSRNCAVWRARLLSGSFWREE